MSAPALSRHRSWFVGGLLSLLLLWVVGFFLYVDDVSALRGQAAAPEAALLARGLTATPPPSESVAIVVLTGGSERIATGLRLLQQGYGQQLFISGAGAGASLAQLLAGQQRNPVLERCCVSVGHQADDTVGNAAETAQWLQQAGQPQAVMRRIILVTAHYHMQRSLLEFARLLGGGYQVYPLPVAPARVDIARWWERPRTAQLLLMEYNKLLVARLRYGLQGFL